MYSTMGRIISLEVDDRIAKNIVCSVTAFVMQKDRKYWVTITKDCITCEKIIKGQSTLSLRARLKKQHKSITKAIFYTIKCSAPEVHKHSSLKYIHRRSKSQYNILYYSVWVV